MYIITWVITGDNTDESGTLSSHFEVYSECVDIVDRCFNFEIIDEFGYGDWI